MADDGGAAAIARRCGVRCAGMSPFAAAAAALSERTAQRQLVGGTRAPAASVTAESITANWHSIPSAARHHWEGRWW